ncbi:putative intraflagellar transport protein component IFT74/72 [Neospora caninum Liverpool]|uniref:Putative intraflagellar transport protein component IFT74/72 n=1 Tax=Neospora caninum (strain Liverpool) TaxID=572307 RepID=F0VR53_NEOCL|nr:putative intraflagellar transport protein component IFT74/72 [Neospora caninum Liverpool]CBZ56201.1 putative intraflagellar transport protein component IFT74/72 [Neospora caninum Liverpool]|eukprot:XP_003886226.1 putative intraflagellar transport protein component IFT74/72 [Neospora caninum Liverpool]
MAGVGYVGIPRMKQNEILEPSGLGVPGTGRTASLRQVADPTYFFILLKEKHRDLRREIGKFQAQMEVLGREAEQLPAMRRRKSELEKEVEELQEEIVTINSAVTHGRENLRPEALATTAKEMKEKNEEKKLRLLAAKDAELSAFIERYSEGREKRAVAEAAEEAELSEAEKLSELLEEQLRAVPTPEQAETFTSALKERKTALQKAEQDLLEAKRQLEEKQKELQREGKLGQISEDELRVLSKHLEDMREEIERKLDKTDELRLLIEEERNQLAQSEQRLRSNLEDVQAEAEAATKQKNAIMKRLQANTVHQRLEQLEAELECHRRDVEAVRKAVDMQKQLDPNALTVACMSVVEKIHEKLRARTLKSHWRHHERTAHSVGGTFPKLSRTPAPVRNGNRGGVTAVDVA